MIDMVAFRKSSGALADAIKGWGKAWCAMYKSLSKCDESMYALSKRCGITPDENSRWKKVP